MSFGLARMVVVNRMDRETASFERSLESIQQRLGRMCVPIQIPVGAEKGFKGVVDLVSMKAYIVCQATVRQSSPKPAIPADIDGAREGIPRQAGGSRRGER